jgi:hypothetical protein
MGLESASYISSLNTSNPTSSDFLSQTDDHLRLIKAVLKNTFPDADGPFPLRQIVPIGTIVMWSPTAGAVPTGYAVCSGQTVTRTDGAGTIVVPDLRDRFIVASGSSFSPGQVGGSNSYTTTAAGSHNHTGATGTTVLDINQIPSHTHTVNDPGHNHQVSVPAGSGISAGPTSSNSGGSTTNLTTTTSGTGITISATGGNEGHAHTVATDGTHTHLVEGIVPPFYSLLYIMKH